MANLAKKYGLQTPALEILKSCDDIPRGTSDAVQSYEVAGEIICDETRVSMGGKMPLACTLTMIVR